MRDAWVDFDPEIARAIEAQEAEAAHLRVEIAELDRAVAAEKRAQTDAVRRVRLRSPAFRALQDADSAADGGDTGGLLADGGESTSSQGGGGDRGGGGGGGIAQQRAVVGPDGAMMLPQGGAAGLLGSRRASIGSRSTPKRTSMQ